MTLYTSPYPTPRDWRNADGPLGGGDTSTIVDAAALEDIELRAQRGDEFISDADVTGAVSVLSKIEAAATRLGENGGVIWLPPTRYDQPEAIKCDGFLDLGDAPIALRGPGSRHCKIACTNAGAGIRINNTIAGEGRNGWSGGFSIFGNQVALGENSEGVLQLGGVNTVLFDVGVYNMPGIAFRFNGSQNMSCYNLNADDSGAKGPDSIGYFFDRGASGINMHSTKSNYCQGGMVIFDCTDDTGPASECKNITFYGNMLERMKSYNPAIHIKTADNIAFRGGNICHNQIDDLGGGAPDEEYVIVKIDNTNANGGDTKNISFDALEINGSTQGGSDRWATAFEVAADCNGWHHTLHVGASITWVNVKNAFDVQATDVLVTCDGVNKGNGNGGVGLGGGGIDKPGSVGKVNTRSTASASTVTPRGVDRVLDITGTTNINTLTATMPGQKIWLKFNGSLSLGSGGNLKSKVVTLPLSVASGDMVQATCDGTNWHIG